MSTTRPTPKRPKASVARPQKPRDSRKKTDVRSVIDAVEKNHSRLCALQLLNCRAAITAGDLVDAPVSDASPVHVFCTETKATISPFGITGASANALRLQVNPRPQNHLFYGNAYDANGLPTAYTGINVENYASWASVYDDVRCAAMMIVVKSSGRTDSENGSCFLANFNPRSASMTVSSSTLRGEDGIEYPTDKMHYPSVPWLPARPEVDHAFFAPTADVNSDSTVLMFDFRGAYESPATNVFEVVSYCIWAGRLLNDVEYVARPKIYAIDQSLFEKELQYQLYELPLYAQRRIMHKDDGDGSDVAVEIGKGVQAGAKLYSAAKEGWSAVTQIAESVGNVFSSIFGSFGARERVARRLCSLTSDELLLAQQFLTTPGIATNPRAYMYIVSLERRKRRHLARSSRTFVDLGHNEEDPDDYVIEDTYVARIDDTSSVAAAYAGIATRAPPPSTATSRAASLEPSAMRRA